MNTFLKHAIDEARHGLREGGIPIGSIVVKDGEIIGKGHNMRVQNNDPTAHAEIECIRNTGRIGTFKGTILYSTLTPCYLCAGAAVQFGINRVIVGESRNFEGAREFMTSKVLKLSMWIPQNAWKSCVDLLQSIQICGMKISVECELLYCVCQFFGCPVRVSDV